MSNHHFDLGILLVFPDSIAHLLDNFHVLEVYRLDNHHFDLMILLVFHHSMVPTPPRLILKKYQTSADLMIPILKLI